VLLSILGIIVFFGVHDAPVAGVFIGLTCVYLTEFFASLKPDRPAIGAMAERALGFFRIGTGFWLSSHISPGRRGGGLKRGRLGSGAHRPR
jgi:hypothetical protein